MINVNIDWPTNTKKEYQQFITTILDYYQLPPDIENIVQNSNNNIDDIISVIKFAKLHDIDISFKLTPTFHKLVKNIAERYSDLVMQTPNIFNIVAKVLFK